MEAYAAPFAAAALAGLLVALSLGALRLARLTRDRARPHSGPPPGAARDAVPDAADPLLPRLAFRLLAVALFLGLSGLLLFAPAGGGASSFGSVAPGGVPSVPLHPLAILTLLAAWIAGVRE